MKVIERADTTTYEVPFQFHLLKNVEEVKNVLHNVKQEEIVMLRRTIHPETWQPLMWFMINKQMTREELLSGIYKTQFYVVSPGLMLESGLWDAKEKKVITK